MENSENLTLTGDEKYNLKFYLVCQLFESLVKAKSKLKVIGSFLQKYFKDCKDLYPLLRLMYPRYDRERGSYGIQESFLGRYYVEILSLPEKEKQMLKHWKNPSYQPVGAPAGDFVGTLAYILNTRCGHNSNMKINEVNDFLDELCKSTTEEKSTCMAKLIQKASVIEQKWIAAIIIKDIKHGLSHETFFKYLDPRALEVFNSTSSLIEVANFLKDPNNSKYANSFFQLFLPIKPMLAGRMKLNNIIENFASTNLFVETKYDGERIQCHFHNKEVKFFTRNAIDYTALYAPKLFDPLLKSINAKSVILDGEIVVWDKISKKYAPFGENKPTAIGDESEKQLVYIIFDILYLVTTKGEELSLINVVLSDRKEILKKIINVIPNKIEIVEVKEASTIDEVLACFTDSIAKGEEGIIIKKRDSIYRPDERSVDWIKMKVDYIDSLTDTLDLVIVGGYYGQGRRIQSHDWNDHINSFLMGVVKTVNSENPRNSVILPLVTVGTGLTYEEMEIVRQRLKPIWKKYDTKFPPSIFNYWVPAIGERPDVYIENPIDTIVLELKGAEIIQSDSFPTKITVRFPRVVRIRNDKSWLDALKYDEILKFYEEMQHNLIVKDKRKIEDLEPEALLDIDKDKKKKKIDKFSKILDTFRDTETKNIIQVSNLFQGFEFIVLNLDDNISQNAIKKKALESCIVEHGGRKVQNFLSSTTHVVAFKLDVRAQNILKTKDVDILNPKWVYDSLKYERLMTISPIYLTYTSKSTKNNFTSTIDKYNDNYFENSTTEGLLEIFSQMKSFENEKDFRFILEEMKKEYQESEIFKKIINDS